MKKLFNPKSVAIVGASTKPGKLGYSILSNIVHSDYNGEIYPVNPKADEILGKKAYSSVLKLPKKVDLAVIAIPARFVIHAVLECINKEIFNIVIISAGFKEIGGEGVKLEKELQKIIKEHNVNLVGPNCLGITNTHMDLNASFAEGMPRKGKIALLSQSGAMAVAITDWAYDENIGFSKVVSLGNKAGVDENSCLEYLANDTETEVIMMYLESFVDGKKFMELARKIVPKKPIIVFKSGTSEAGSAAVSSHTGALSGGDTAVETALRQSGVLRAHCIEDFFNLARLVSMQPIPKGNKIAVVTNAGGPGVITTDAIDKSSSLELAQFSAKTTEKLKKSLPSTANIHNPVDIIGDALADRYTSAFDATLADKNVDILFAILTPQIMTEKEDTARALTQYSSKYPEKTCVASFIGGKNIEYAAEKLAENNIPNFVFPKTAVQALEYMVFLREWREKNKKHVPKIKHNKKSVKVRSHIVNEIKNGKTALSQKLVTDLLEAYDIKVPEIMLTKSENKAVQFAKEIGYPVVLKISSDDVLHKTDSGGVRLDIENEEDLRKAYQEILKNIKKNCPKAKIDGILVQKMYHLGREVLIGMTRDPIFGPLIAFGLGGIYVEVMKDVSFRVAPLSMNDALEMIHETKAIRLLKGVRGEAPSDIKVLAETLVKISQLSLDIPEITEIDLNPMLVFEKGAVALDGRVIL